MKKQYKLLVETADFPQGIIIESEDLETPDEEAIMYIYTAPDRTTHMFKPWQVENRPTVWELIEDEKVENEYLPFIPVLRETYWFATADGQTSSMRNDMMATDKNRITLGVFRTEQGAKYEALRRESVSKRWKPSEDDFFYYYDFEEKKIYQDSAFSLHSDITDYLIGNTHKTEQDAAHWADKYSIAWRVLL